MSCDPRSDTCDSRDPTPSEYDEDAALEERQYLGRCLRDFELYTADAIRDPIVAHQPWLKDLDAWNNYLKAVRANQSFFNSVLDHATSFNSIVAADTTREELRRGERKDFEELRARSIQELLPQIMREWSGLGSNERQTCFRRILAGLARHLPLANDPQCQRDGETEGQSMPERKVHVLVPGCGTGRLVWELARAGYCVVGNEVSYPMLLTANYILNGTQHANQHIIYPLLHHVRDLTNHSDQLMAVSIPDVSIREPIPDAQVSSSSPSTALSSSSSVCYRRMTMAMVSGDFVEIIPEFKNSFDAIVTCFFLDTAVDVSLYIGKVSDLLRTGGIWINFGPLTSCEPQYTNDISICWNQFRDKLPGFGLKVLDQEVGLGANYAASPSEISKSHYDCVYFACTKEDQGT